MIKNIDFLRDLLKILML